MTFDMDFRVFFFFDWIDFCLLIRFFHLSTHLEPRCTFNSWSHFHVFRSRNSTYTSSIKDSHRSQSSMSTSSSIGLMVDNRQRVAPQPANQREHAVTDDYLLPWKQGIDIGIKIYLHHPPIVSAGIRSFTVCHWWLRKFCTFMAQRLTYMKITRYRIWWKIFLVWYFLHKWIVIVMAKFRRHKNCILNRGRSRISFKDTQTRIRVQSCRSLHISCFSLY